MRVFACLFGCSGGSPAPGYRASLNPVPGCDGDGGSASGGQPGLLHVGAVAGDPGGVDCLGEGEAQVGDSEDAHGAGFTAAVPTSALTVGRPAGSAHSARPGTGRGRAGYGTRPGPRAPPGAPHVVEPVSLVCQLYEVQGISVIAMKASSNSSTLLRVKRAFVMASPRTAAWAAREAARALWSV